MIRKIFIITYDFGTGSINTSLFDKIPILNIISVIDLSNTVYYLLF